MKYISTSTGDVCPNCYHPALECFRVDSRPAACSLVKLAEKWERLAASWLEVARDRSDDTPDLANRAQARAAIYQDCAEDLKASKTKTS